MDIEKLIEDLRGLLKQYGEKIPYGELVGAPWPYSRAGDLVWQAPEPYFIEQAATALSTLQTENKKLRAELKQVKEERDAAVKDIELIVRRINDCNIKLDDGTTVSSLELGRCHVCKHEETGDCGGGGCIFEWRGPQKED